PQRAAGTIRSSRVQLERHPELGLRLPERREPERLWHHADDDVLLAVKLTWLPDDGGISAETTSPERVGDHDQMRVATAIVWAMQRATDHGANAENIEQPRADLERRNSLGPTAG